MRDYYERRAGEYDEWYLRLGRFANRVDPERWHSEVEMLRRRVSEFGAGRLLEIASGTGWWTQHLARRAAVMALDYSPAMLAQVKARLTGAGLDAQRIRADAYALPFQSGAFESCFTGFFLSHVPSVRMAAFLAEVRRVMRPHGLVMVIDSALEGETSRAGEEFFQERTLNDGSRHQVLKILHSAATLSAALKPLGEVIEAWETGGFFAVAVMRVVKAAVTPSA